MDERTFRRYAKEYLEAKIFEIKKALFEKLEKAFESGAIPDHWKKTGNHFIVKAIVDSFCQDRPDKLSAKDHIKEINNLHLFL